MRITPSVPFHYALSPAMSTSMSINHLLNGPSEAAKTQPIAQISEAQPTQVHGQIGDSPQARTSHTTIALNTSLSQSEHSSPSSPSATTLAEQGGWIELREDTESATKAADEKRRKNRLVSRSLRQRQKDLIKSKDAKIEELEAILKAWRHHEVHSSNCHIALSDTLSRPSENALNPWRN